MLMPSLPLSGAILRVIMLPEHLFLF